MLDIRNNGEEEITQIRFADNQMDNATILEAVPSENEGETGVVSIGDDDGVGVLIYTEEDAHNLIKALNRAIELGWFA